MSGPHPPLNKGFRPVYLYRPRSGTEGFAFMESWCGNCERDKEWSEGKPFDECGPDEVCQLIADSYAYDVADPNYPREWVVAAHGQPMCLAFKRKGTPYRCLVTVDMFTGKSAL